MMGRLHPPQLHLQSLWRLTEVLDSSGNSHTLTAYGTPPAATFPAKFESAVTFSANKYLYMTSWGYDLTADFTTMGWFLINTQPVGSEIQIFQDLTSTLTGKSRRCILYYKISSGVIEIEINFLNNIFDYVWTAPLNTWHHIALVRSGANYLVYLDGYYIGGAACGTATTTNNTMYLGCLYDVTDPLKGTLDEWAFFDEAKSAQWINRYYAWATGKLV